MVTAVVRRRRYATRYRQITTTLVGHGLGGLLAPLGISLGGLMRGQQLIDPVSRPAHLRLALEELGPTFVKLGQILSTRADLLPAEYIAELVRLQDHVPPVPFAEIEAVIVAELGKPITELFATFDTTPLAAASIGQVHAATLADGRDVVIKVQRPGIERIIDEDLAILADMAMLASQRVTLAAQLDLPGLVREFSWTLRGELDYVREGRNADHFRRTFERNPDVIIPEIFWPLTTRRVLTMDRLRGLRIDDLAGLREAGHERPDLALRAARLILHEVFEDGFFHADPHPGNFVVTAEGAIGVMDFGMVGTLSERLREQLLFLMLAIVDRDSQRIAEDIITLGGSGADVDRGVLERDLDHLIGQYVGRPLSEIQIGAVIGDAADLVRRHHLRLPVELALLAKTLAMSEAMGRQLDPGFEATRMAEPYVRDALRRFYSPHFWRERMKVRTLETAMLASSLPGQTQRLLNRLERNQMTVHVRNDNEANSLRALNGMVNRLILALLAAAMGVSLAVLYTAVEAPIRSIVGLLFMFGFLGTGALAAGLLFAVWRGANRR